MSTKTIQPNQTEDLICVVVGTRPGIIKLAPVIKELKKRRVPFFVINARQHYSREMNAQFFKELELPRPDYFVPPPKKDELHGEQTARMLCGIERVLLKEKPRFTVVAGDANVNLAGALAACKLRLGLAHVEAGLRSNDRRMPEEHNRVMIDHISDLLLAPTNQARENLIKDGVRGSIHVVGNTIVDSVRQNFERALRHTALLSTLGVRKQGYILLTLHREENVDSEKNICTMLDILALLDKELHIPVVFPIHPRTRKRLELLRAKLPPSVIPTKPLGYLDFLAALGNSQVVLTDSGGIQEETCILRVGCVTLRDNTERPETVEVGANVVAGLDPHKVLNATKVMTKTPKTWANPFGEKPSEKIVCVLERTLARA